jgi:hypothetical protein
MPPGVVMSDVGCCANTSTEKRIAVDRWATT